MTITYATIGLTVLISFLAFNQDTLVRRFILNPYLIDKRNQYYRFITSGFIHKDYVHLLWNMISLYFFGSVVEKIFLDIFGQVGGLYFITLYIMGIIVSDVPTFFKQRNNPGYNALGASGGVSAVIFASIIFEPLDKICFYVLFCMPGFILGILFIVFSYYQGKRSRDNINHEAHLYGALFGLIFCIVLYPSSIRIFFEKIMEWRLL